MTKEKQMNAVDKFRNELMCKFIHLCQGNDYKKLTLLKISDVVDQAYDKQIDDIKNDNKEGYRKQSEGEWIDRYNGKYANSLYVCSFCDERAPLYIKADELGNEQIVQMLSQFCPNCGAKMKGGSE